MRFEGRDLKPYAEPVVADALEIGTIYFAVNFVDQAMLVPTMEPWVFVGRDLDEDEHGQVYFQDVDSYRSGIRYAETGQAKGTFIQGSQSEVNHIFDFERALDVLLACSIRRSEHS